MRLTTLNALARKYGYPLTALRRAVEQGRLTGVWVDGKLRIPEYPKSIVRKALFKRI